MRYVIIPLVIILYIALTIKGIKDIRKYKRQKVTQLYPELSALSIIWMVFTSGILLWILIDLSIKYW